MKHPKTRKCGYKLDLCDDPTHWTWGNDDYRYATPDRWERGVTIYPYHLGSGRYGLYARKTDKRYNSIWSVSPWTFPSPYPETVMSYIVEKVTLEHHPWAYKLLGILAFRGYGESACPQYQKTVKAMYRTIIKKKK